MAPPSDPRLVTPRGLHCLRPRPSPGRGDPANRRQPACLRRVETRRHPRRDDRCRKLAVRHGPTHHGHGCRRPDTTAPTPGVVLDPFGGTGTTALVAVMHGRTGISADASADYCHLAHWRANDPRQRAKAATPLSTRGQSPLIVTPATTRQRSVQHETRGIAVRACLCRRCGNRGGVPCRPPRWVCGRRTWWGWGNKRVGVSGAVSCDGEASVRRA
ncbi:DNA methyltransferase [Actinokineospora iranica]|uniref:DNA methyltransferase n=1 Tax=Actinokineospora iranica TaxID=1271860 RepID=UPI00111416F9